MQREGAAVLVVTRFPFVYPGRRAAERYRRRLYLREELDGVTVLRLRIAGERVIERVLDRIMRLYARLRARRQAPLLGKELIELLYGLLALPLIAALRPRAVVVEQGPVWLGLPLWSVARVGVALVLQVSDVKSLALARGRYGGAAAARIDLNRRLENFLYRRAAAIVTVTDALRAHIAARLGQAEATLHLIPNGAEVDIVERLDARERQRCKRRLDLTGKFVVLYAGTFGVAHDLHTVLEAARRLREIPDLAFLFIGEGPVEQELVQSAARWGLGNVTFRRGVSLTELAPVLGAADAGVSPEISGLRDTVRAKIYLYMAARLPVVVTDDDGEGRALINRAQAGYLVPPGDAAAMAARLLELKRQPRMAALLGENGRRFVERHHARSELAQHFARVVLDRTMAAADAPKAECPSPIVQREHA